MLSCSGRRGALVAGGVAPLVCQLRLELLDGTLRLLHLGDRLVDFPFAQFGRHQVPRLGHVADLMAHEAQLRLELLARARIVLIGPLLKQRRLLVAVVALLAQNLCEAVEEVGVALHQNQIELCGRPGVEQSCRFLLP